MHSRVTFGTLFLIHESCWQLEGIGGFSVCVFRWSTQGRARICASHKSHIHPFTLAFLWFSYLDPPPGPQRTNGFPLDSIWDVCMRCSAFGMWRKSFFWQQACKSWLFIRIPLFSRLLPPKLHSYKTPTAVYIMHFWVGWGRAALGCKSLDQSIIW